LFPGSTSSPLCVAIIQGTWPFMAADLVENLEHDRVCILGPALDGPSMGGFKVPSFLAIIYSIKAQFYDK
jgi:hypothetical protein